MTTTIKASILRHPTKTMADTLRNLADRAELYTESDVYGQGELIENFEAKVADMLGKPAALFVPSGTLAQPMALKIHSERKQKPGVALHPTSHLVMHEHDGFQKLWGLEGVLAGDSNKVLSYQDLLEVQPERLAAILLELPMREIGGQLPTWEDLQAQVHWARQHDIAVHIDGARLWHCPAYYQRSLAEIATLADSVYVSLYKDIGGIAGAVLAGDTDFIEEARIWNRRAGGNLISFYPYVLAAEQGLADNLASIEDAVAYAQDLGPLLAAITGVKTNPETPQSAMFHLHINHSHAQVIAATQRYLQETGILVLPKPRNTDQNYSVCEISVGRSTMAHTPDFWEKHLKACLGTIAQ